MNRYFSLLLLSVLLAVLSLVPRNSEGQSYAPPELDGCDALGRCMPLTSQVRPFQQDKYVGLFYFTWLRLNRVYDTTKILENHRDAIGTTASPPWGPKNAYHFWGEPMFGYYRSDDPWVIRRHAALLSDAGVDFLVLDATNAVTYDNVVKPMLEVFEQQRALGEHVPKLTFMLNTRAGKTAQHLYETFYKPAQYPELWFQWQGKPLLICDPAEASAEVAEFFTLRKAHWPFELVNTQNAWHWEATYPQVYSYDTDPSKPEQVNVSVGQNLHQQSGRVEMMSTGFARGRSFHDGKMATEPDAYKLGLNFQEQWQRALELDPQVTFITGWNEWIAMQLNTGDGRPVFCDQFNLEFSRDAEMMKGGYGDNYYMQMAANIRRFKGMQPSTVVSKRKTIDLSDTFDQWRDIQPPYQDQALDTLPRDYPGCGKEHYKVDSGRNDFLVSKVSEDADNVYFYVRTREPITAPTDPNWMWLLIGVNAPELPNSLPEKANWEGFHFIINRLSPSDTVPSESQASIEVCQGDWNWNPIGEVTYRVQGDQMHIGVPKRLLGVEGAEGVSLTFKWIDHAQTPGDIMDTYIHGDAAPNGRFRYRYQSR